ncbi:MAG: AAR2 pre-mRNA splicing protein [Promethearchaeota archaeon]
MWLMLGYIILRDIPKYRAQLDLSIYEIQGGFRGFTQVEPGIHYVSIETGNGMAEGFWCFVKPNDAIIKVYDYENEKFINADDETEAQYKVMALSGAMNRALIPILQINFQMAEIWRNLTSRITNNPPILHKENPMTPPIEMNPEELENWYLDVFKSRFEQAFYDSHMGNFDKFLAEFQWVFIKYIVNQEDNSALDRWIHLIQAMYNAGESSIGKNPKLFVEFIYLLQLQFDCLEEKDIRGNIVSGINKIIEDMQDIGVIELTLKAKSLESYLEKRGIKI